MMAKPQKVVEGPTALETGPKNSVTKKAKVQLQVTKKKKNLGTVFSRLLKKVALTADGTRHPFCFR